MPPRAGQGRAASPTAGPQSRTGTGQGSGSQGLLAPGNTPTKDPNEHNQNRDPWFLLIQEKSMNTVFAILLMDSSFLASADEK